MGALSLKEGFGKLRVANIGDDENDDGPYCTGALSLNDGWGIPLSDCADTVAETKARPAATEKMARFMVFPLQDD
jgi:hypothetical protein